MQAIVHWVAKSGTVLELTEGTTIWYCTELRLVHTFQTLLALLSSQEFGKSFINPHLADAVADKRSSSNFPPQGNVSLTILLIEP